MQEEEQPCGSGASGPCLELTHILEEATHPGSLGCVGEGEFV